ncbi:MAG: ABC transporter permease [Candidatus Latescibacteria bacterium]|nr:ABC transporter permease [Candidatus Latescibacterota bacterium]
MVQTIKIIKIRAGTGACPYKKDMVNTKSQDQPMKSFITLYRKELKSISGLILILVVLFFFQIVLDFLTRFLSEKYQYHFIFIEGHAVRRHISYYLRYRFSYSSTEILAVIFAYLLIIEQKTKTNFQLCSLPVRSSKIIFAKLLAVVSVGLIFSFLRSFHTSGTLNILYQWYNGEYTFIVDRWTKVPIDFDYLLYRWWKNDVLETILSSLLRLSLFCSFVVIARAGTTAVNRYRTAIGILTFIGTFSLYMYFGRIIYNGFSIYRSLNLLTVATINVLLFAGMKLTEKFDEV